MAGRFRLNGKTYEMSAINEISLKDLVLFNTQAEDMGLRNFRWDDVERTYQEISKLKSPQEAAKHPNRHLMIAVTVWISRQKAGDNVTLEEAISFGMDEIEFLPDPEDRKPGPTRGASKRKAPAKKATKKAAASRTASARATGSAPTSK